MDFSARRQTLESRRKSFSGVLARGELNQNALNQNGLAQPDIAPPSAETLCGIEAALAHLRSSSDGFCRICGERIGDDWSALHPQTPFCQCCSR